MKNLISFFTASFLCILTNGYGQGTFLAGHFGAANPTTEGFTLLQQGTPLLGPAIGDLGLNAWSIQLNTGDIGQYSHNLTAQEAAQIASERWILSLTLRVVEPFSAPTFGTFAQLYTGSQNFYLLWGAQADGDPVVKVQGSTEFVIAGSGYHNYQIKYDGGLASFWVDGAYLTDVAGAANPASSRFSWGGGQHPSGSAYANWAEAALSVVPEPSSLALLGGGGLLLWAVVRRRARTDGQSRG